MGVCLIRWPGLLDPAVDRVLVALGGATHRALHAPAEPMVQQRPHVRGVVAHAGQPLDHQRDAVQGPQLPCESVGGGARQQDLFDLAELAVR